MLTFFILYFQGKLEILLNPQKTKHRILQVANRMLKVQMTARMIMSKMNEKLHNPMAGMSQALEECNNRGAEFQPHFLSAIY